VIFGENFEAKFCVKTKCSGIACRHLYISHVFRKYLILK
jgi:hypothetical protein